MIMPEFNVETMEFKCASERKDTQGMMKLCNATNFVNSQFLFLLATDVSDSDNFVNIWISVIVTSTTTTGILGIAVLVCLKLCNEGNITGMPPEMDTFLNGTQQLAEAGTTERNQQDNGKYQVSFVNSQCL